VLADATQIHQVLMNLAVNARDAMLPLGHEGRLAICLQNQELTGNEPPLHPEAKAGRYLRLTVSDTGIGIAPENIGKIWEQFFSLKAAGQGTGLGLHTVLTIVRSHGGFVHVESEPGNGSCFDIYLPAASAAADADESQSADPIPPGRGETILVIDDERAFQELTRAIFNKHGYRVVTAGDGAEALALFAQRHRHIDLVVTDMMMPCVDGPATIRGLHRIKPGLPVIATSGLGDNEAALREFDRTTFLLKPFTAETLLQAVTRSLRASASQPSRSP
jgi:CheY-like chemotaxis protein